MQPQPENVIPNHTGKRISLPADLIGNPNPAVLTGFPVKPGMTLDKVFSHSLLRLGLCE